MSNSEALGGNSGKISLVGHAGFDDGEGLLKELVTNRNQGHFAIFTFSYQTVVERFTSLVEFYGGEAAPKKFAPN